MTKTTIDSIYKEIKIRVLLEKFSGSNSVKESLGILNNILMNMNVTKCSLSDLESENPHASLYLTFLLQSEDGIYFDLCEHFKMWYNRNGEQKRCRFNTGPIQVACYASLDRCENFKKYQEFKQTNSQTKNA